jgi:hypothetical protein
MEDKSKELMTSKEFVHYLFSESNLYETGHYYLGWTISILKKMMQDKKVPESWLTDILRDEIEEIVMKQEMLIFPELNRYVWVGPSSGTETFRVSRLFKNRRQFIYETYREHFDVTLLIEKHIVPKIRPDLNVNPNKPFLKIFKY